MLLSKILGKKKVILNKDSNSVTDMIYSTFRFPSGEAGSGITAVNEYENMRPDLLANRIYGDQSKWDAMLKYNGISNPFSLKFGDILYTLSYSAMDGVYIKPRDIAERGERAELPRPPKKGAKDPSRLKNIEAKATSGPNGQLPPNVNKAGDKNVKVKDGRVIFGEDVTTVNKENCPVPISRARLQTALLKDKLFL